MNKILKENSTKIDNFLFVLIISMEKLRDLKKEVAYENQIMGCFELLLKNIILIRRILL